MSTKLKIAAAVAAAVLLSACSSPKHEPGVSALTATLQLSVFGTAIWKLWMPKARSAGKRN